MKKKDILTLENSLCNCATPGGVISNTEKSLTILPIMQLLISHKCDVCQLDILIMILLRRRFTRFFVSRDIAFCRTYDINLSSGRAKTGHICPSTINDLAMYDVMEPASRTSVVKTTQ